MSSVPLGTYTERQRKRGMANMWNYFDEFSNEGRPFSLDEFGGAEGSGTRYFDNDAMIQAMLEQIAKLEEISVSFDYATIFLDEKKYGVDADLGFLHSTLR